MISERKKQMLLFFLRDRNKKKWSQIIKEFMTLYINVKELPLNYISHLLYRKSVLGTIGIILVSKKTKNYLNGLIHMRRTKLYWVENKLLFAAFLSKENIPTPQIFLHNSKNKFTYKGEVFGNRD